MEEMGGREPTRKESDGGGTDLWWQSSMYELLKLDCLSLSQLETQRISLYYMVALERDYFILIR